MNYWYFSFEGKFIEGSPQFGCGGVFSNCLVPESDYEKAKRYFLRSLNEERIDLVKIGKEFEINGDELDPSDEINTFWIEIYNRAKKEGRPVYDKWQVFDDEQT